MKYLFDRCVILSAAALYFVLFAVISAFNSYNSMPISPKVIADKCEHIPPPKYFVRRTPNYALENYKYMKRLMGQIPFENCEIVLGEPHTMFITAYCAEECGWNYWTSSDTYCHRANWINRHSEPTTCAVDLNYFPYGTMFYVPSEDRVYIAEDTGAFRGMWIDLYQDDMSDVIGYNTRYETVYEVSIEYHTVSSGLYDYRKYFRLPLE